MDKSRLELKIGLFILGALIILSLFILKIGNLKSYGSGYQLRFVFGNVSGVKTGSPVRLAGVNVGEVNRVNVIKDEQNKNIRIEVAAWIRKTQLVPEGSEAFINTLGLLGEKYIEIVPPRKYKKFYRPGEIIVGTDPIMMHHWVDEGEKILGDLKEIIIKLKEGEGTAGKILNDDKLYQELEGLISDIRQAKQGTIGRLLYDDTLYKELEALISDIRRHPWKLFYKTKEKTN
ncbi:MAG: MlaD family protein [Candidatus Omnitrophota bacterium]|jgi:phospholipid/cholesterol/gamma-HCH transport system substrate-binding protein